MKKETYHIEIMTSISDALIAEWNNLWKEAHNASIFNSYEWFRTCQETGFLKEYELHLCYLGEKLVAILPVQTYKRFGISVSGSIGNRFLVDTAFLAESYDKDLLRFFFSHLIHKRNFHLQKIDSEAATMLHGIFPHMFFTLLSVNPCVHFTDDPFVSVSPSTVSQIKKILRKNPDQFHFELYDGNTNLQDHLRTLFALEQHSSKKLRSMDIFSEQKNKDFFTLLSKNAPDLVRIGFLYYNNDPISYQYGFLLGKIFIAYQTAYVYEYGKLRPGKTMLFHLLEKLKSLHVETLDLGGGISVYKQEFTPDYRVLYDLYYSRNPFIMFWWKAINMARRKKQLLFPKKNTRDHEFLFRSLPENAGIPRNLSK